jgi:prepilin-type N-terminal cleavage/methylation domain-containing protein
MLEVEIDPHPSTGRTMSDHTVISNSAVRRRIGFTLVEVAIVVAIVALLGWLLWLRFGAAAPGVLNPIISAVAPAGSTVTVDVYGEFTRAPTTLGNTSFRTDFKLIAVPPGTTVNAGMRLPPGVTRLHWPQYG